MPFKSEKQKRYLWANEPEIARDWTDTYGSRIKKNDGGITQLVKSEQDRMGAAFGGIMGADGRRGYVGGSYSTAGTSDKSERGSYQGRDDSGGRGGTYSGSNQGPDSSYVKPAQQASHERVVAEAIRANDEAKRIAELKKKAKKKKALSIFGFSPTRYIAEKFGKKGMAPYIKHQQNKVDKAFLNDPSLEDYDEDDLKSRFGSYATDANLTQEAYDARMDAMDKAKAGALGQSEFEQFIPGGKYGRDVLDFNGEGQGGGYMGYPSYAAWQAAQGGGGGGGTTTATTAANTPSAFQQSLTTTADTPGYYVGNDPTASNLAWGKTYGTDPRTMGRTSWAADGGRIGRAYGGIMDSSTGRRAYGFGSIFSKIGKAAKKVFKSPIGKAALLGGLGMYGANAGWFSGGGGGGGGGSEFWGNLKNKLFMKNLAEKGAEAVYTGTGEGLSWGKLGILGAGLLPWTGLGDASDDEDEGFDYAGAKNKYWDEIMRIKSGAMAGSLDPNKFNYLGVRAKDGGRIGLYAGGQSTPSDYTMEDAMMTTTQDKLGGITDVMKQADLSRQGSVGQFYAAQGGRIGYDEGGPAEIGGDNISEVLKRVQELEDEGLDFGAAMAQAMKELSQGKAHGGRIGYADAGKVWGMDKAQAAWNKLGTNSKLGYVDFVDFFLNGQWGSNQYRTGSDKLAEGGRIGAEEGGLMDLGGMEKDYRNDGGFVPLGGEEKADDVPARLSKNEFVFTADAVRGAGEGDIDKGAEIMENIMKNLEQGGKISEETQGNTGAQGMFDVSERLGEVI